MDPENYFIKPGYNAHKTPHQFNDSEEDALTYQLDVYKFAAAVARQYGSQNVLDIGCGHALKLLKYIHPVVPDITGIDLEHSIGYCRKNHQVGHWLVDNIESSALKSGQLFDLIISADVIEHLVDPDTLLRYIKARTHQHSMIIISTPERDLRRGKTSIGPPPNRAHIREWNKSELATYLEDRGFKIVDHQIMNLKEGMATCQTVLCSLR